ncbi:MAG: sulfatase-like hydrolase/transferase [Bacteroidota bacterium]
MLRFILCLSLLGLLTACHQHEPKLPPNVLFITVDDLGPFLPCYDYPAVHSPRFDELATRSVLFANTHCQVALCTPSRTSVLTGVRPTKSGILQIDDNWQTILPDARSLPRHFRDHGYYVHAVGKIYDTRNGGMDHAFDYDDPEALRDNDRALTALAAVADTTQPFFLALGYAQPHTPWEPDAPSLAHYSPAEIDVSAMSRNFRGEELTTTQLQARVARFYAVITEVDSLVGAVIDRAEALGLLDNTILVVGSLDHGFSLGWRGHYGKGNNFDPETQVPLFIRLPGGAHAGARVRTPTELLDLYPTLIDYCGLPSPPHTLDGRSLRPFLEDPTQPSDRAAFSQRAYHPDDFGVKTERYTLVAWTGEDTLLFDRRQDPLNLQDIAPQHPLLVDSLLELWTLLH